MVERRVRELTRQIGRAGLNAQFPDEFELYLVTLELTDSLGKTIEYLSFPVSPKSSTVKNRTVRDFSKLICSV